MNILTFNYEYPPLGGGGGVAHALIAEALAVRHGVCVITSAFGDLPRHEVIRGVEVFRTPVLGRRDHTAASLTSVLSYPLSSWIQAALVLRHRTFDVIHGYFAVPSGAGSVVLARSVGLPHVVTLLGGDVYDPSKRLSPHRVAPIRWAVDAVLKHSHAVVADSRNVRENTYRYYRYRGPIEVIPLGFRQPHVPPARRAELGLPRDVFLAVTVGRLVRRKGVEQLLQALRKPECSMLHLVVVGSGPEMQRLSNEAAQTGVATRVTFAGQVSEERKWQILEAADVYVSATMHEGFGLAYLEAMAAGLPVITYDEGGHLDFLQHGETGTLVAAGDVAALANALARAAECSEAQARIGQANRRRAAEHRIEQCAKTYEALFERVIAASAIRSPTDDQH